MYLEKGQSLNLTSYLLCHAQASARAFVRGSDSYPAIDGVVSFYEIGRGIIVSAEFRGLPKGDPKCPETVFGFHIHSGTSCTGNAEDPFADADGHYNPNQCPHPAHAGDLPPLFGSDGQAWIAFYTNRFVLSEILGKTIIVHNKPDDFTSQPAGNSGEKIACGLIEAI
ncbi:MAG: superoxide dismutase family protein [Oscillospiraceae bacterium]